jgi:universal stress protein E
MVDPAGHGSFNQGYWAQHVRVEVFMARRYFRNILVGIEAPSERRQFALGRAAQMARQTGARLILFHCAFSPYAAGRNSYRSIVKRGIKRTIAEKRAALEKLAAPLRRKGLKITTRAVWDYPAFEAIVREVLRAKPDLVVAESRRHAFGARLFLTNTDWQLIRLCPVPLLFVKKDRPWGKARVLAALDPMHANAKPARLDQRILEVAQALAACHSGRLDVAHAYLPLSYFMPGGYGETIPIPVERDVERNHVRFTKRALERSVAALDLPQGQLHLETGVAHQILPDLARRLRADVLVMGAVSRRGIDRLIIGSTAERTIDRAPCDVLVVKPRRFRTTVLRRSSPPQLLLPPV